MKQLLISAGKYSEDQLNAIESLGYEINHIEDERIPLEIDVTRIDAVICNGLFLYNDIRKFRNLRFIQLASTGLDRVPLEYIQEHGIKLANAKGVYSTPMAEWAILKILEIYKKSRQFYGAQSEHKWEKQRTLLELTDKTASIIGFGDVGSQIAKRLKVFDVNVIGVGRREREPQQIDAYYRIQNIDEVLRISDIVILTLPLTGETFHLISADKISKMKKHCVLINISRGSIVDEEALIETLQDGKFLGVALDVFENEPLPEDSPLWDLDRVIITPHNSFVSDKTDERLFKIIMENLACHIDDSDIGGKQ